MCGAPIAFRHFMAELSLAVAAAYLYLSFPLPDALRASAFAPSSP